MAPSARPWRVRSVAQRLPRATLAGSAGAWARAPLARPIRHIFAAISRGEPPAIGEEGHWDYSMERAPGPTGFLSRVLAPRGNRNLKPHSSRPMRHRCSKDA